MGWRYQIPHLLKLGFRVVAPDCIGYGRSVSDLAMFAIQRFDFNRSMFQDAPEGSLESYTFKSQAIDFHELCVSLGCRDVVVGAHDW
jgi:soluble epoxide hydrolase/lipid-phosphate phosphatase